MNVLAQFEFMLIPDAPWWANLFVVIAPVVLALIGVWNIVERRRSRREQDKREARRAEREREWMEQQKKSDQTQERLLTMIEANRESTGRLIDTIQELNTDRTERDKFIQTRDDKYTSSLDRLGDAVESHSRTNELLRDAINSSTAQLRSNTEVVQQQIKRIDRLNEVSAATRDKADDTHSQVQSVQDVLEGLLTEAGKWGPKLEQAIRDRTQSDESLRALIEQSHSKMALMLNEFRDVVDEFKSIERGAGDDETIVRDGAGAVAADSGSDGTG